MITKAKEDSALPGERTPSPADKDKVTGETQDVQCVLTMNKVRGESDMEELALTTAS